MTWARTVRSEMPSSRAISSLLNPWRMRPSTSSSRWEIRPPVGLGDDPKAVVERQHVGEPNPHDRVVIDEHHTNGERAGGGGHEVSCGFPARSSASVIGPGGRAYWSVLQCKVDGRSGSCEPCPLAENIYIRTLFEWSVPVGTTRVE